MPARSRALSCAIRADVLWVVKSEGRTDSVSSTTLQLAPPADDATTSFSGKCMPPSARLEGPVANGLDSIPIAASLLTVRRTLKHTAEEVVAPLLDTCPLTAPASRCRPRGPESASATSDQPKASA